MSIQPRILHITADYPDCVNSSTTSAVHNLVHNMPGTRPLIYSLNRCAKPGARAFLRESGCTVVTYFGLPQGIGMRASLQRLSRDIGDDLTRREGFDLIHAHKLTIEGIIGYALSRRFNKPLITTVRGETDMRILAFKPSYRRLYRRIVDHSSALLFLAPWTQARLSNSFGRGIAAKATLLPNITTTPISSPAPPRLSHRFITTARFDDKNIGNKRIQNTVMAFDTAAATLGDISLDIVASGRSRERDKLVQLIGTLKSANRIAVLNKMDHAAYCQILPSYVAFIRPSYPETFGMAFMEALFAGVPVLFSRHTAIDGYLTDAPFALAVDARSTQAIAEGIVRLYREQSDLKLKLAAFLRDDRLARFRKENILETYSDVVQTTLRDQASRAGSKSASPAGGVCHRRFTRRSGVRRIIDGLTANARGR
jgi:glycosyltransferase involved in cell wall biosynthesis